MKYSILFFIIACAFLKAYTQDLSCTIKAQLDGGNTEIDSIRIDNLTNNTTLLLDNFNKKDAYKINLTNGSFWVDNSNTGLSSNPFKNSITLLKNIPGNLTLLNNSSKTANASISIYRITGSKVIDKTFSWELGQTAEVSIEQTGLFIVKVKTENFQHSYKIIGNAKNNFGVPTINVSSQTLLKSVQTKNNEFTCNPGDSLKIIVYKTDYYADPVLLAIRGGEVFIFELKKLNKTFIDARDNREYLMVEIGEQIWMAENLAWLPEVYPPSSKSYNDERYYIYGYNGDVPDIAKNEANYIDYGTLYNWKAAKQACPSGWHLPSDNEWKTLELTLGLTGFNNTEIDKIGWRGLTQGTLLKSDSGWNEGENGVDLYGFAAKPGGHYDGSSSFADEGNAGYWWCSDEKLDINIWCRKLSGNNGGINRNDFKINLGMSIRCIKNSSEITNPDVVTLDPDSITASSAILNARVLDDGGAAIIQRGFYISDINPDPDETSQIEIVDGNIGEYSIKLIELDANTSFYYKAFAKNSNGTATGKAVAVKTLEKINYSAPTIVAYSATEITYSTAILKANIIADGGKTITERGFYWSDTNTTPNKNNNKVIVSGTTGNFEKKLDMLSPETSYYFVAFATNEIGTSTSTVKTFKTGKIPNSNTFVDSRDGHTYKFVKIGNQTWMAENLAWLPEVAKENEVSLTYPYYYVFDYYGNNVNEAKSKYNYVTYGVLYNMPAAVNACPAGWHLPSDDEWKELELFIGIPSNEINELYSTRGLNQNIANKLKTSNSKFWQNKPGTDDYGFNALDGGAKGDFTFDSYGWGEWWTSTYNFGISWAFTRRLGSDNTGIWYKPSKSETGHSVRCVKD